MKVMRSLFIVAACVAIPAGTSAGVIYSNDFETPKSGFDLSNRTSLPTDASGSVYNGYGYGYGPNGSTFLGAFSNQRRWL
jgi:hypothetical protein